MPTINELQHAGNRAAARAVPAAPPLTTISEAASKRSNRRHLLIGALASIGVLAVVAPLTVLRVGDGATEVVAAGAGAAPTAVTQPADPVAPLAGVSDSESEPSEESETGSSDESETGTVAPHGLFGSEGLFGLDGQDSSLSVQIVRGDSAGQAAERAAADADEVIEQDGITVWIQADGAEGTASVLAEPDLFVAVTGPGELIDALAAAATSQKEFLAPWFLADAWPEGVPESPHAPLIPNLDEMFSEDLKERMEERFGDGFFDEEGFESGFLGWSDSDSCISIEIGGSNLTFSEGCNP